MLRERDEMAAKQRGSTQAQLKEHLHLRDEAVAELLRAEEVHPNLTLTTEPEPTPTPTPPPTPTPTLPLPYPYPTLPLSYP